MADGNSFESNSLFEIIRVILLDNWPRYLDLSHKTRISCSVTHLMLWDNVCDQDPRHKENNLSNHPFEDSLSIFIYCILPIAFNIGIEETTYLVSLCKSIMKHKSIESTLFKFILNNNNFYWNVLDMFPRTATCYLGILWRVWLEITLFLGLSLHLYYQTTNYNLYLYLLAEQGKKEQGVYLLVSDLDLSRLGPDLSYLHLTSRRMVK